MEQHADSAQLRSSIPSIPIPLTLLAQGAGATTADAGRIDHAQASVSALFAAHGTKHQPHWTPLARPIQVSVAMVKGTKTLTVVTGAATPNSLILLTPLDNPQAYLWISAHNITSFTIDASQKLPADVTIMYLIIN